jgi:hypothetical protein
MDQMNLIEQRPLAGKVPLAPRRDLDMVGLAPANVRSIAHASET